MSEEDFGMMVRSQGGPYKADYDEDAAPSHSEAETPCWAGDWGVMELSFPDLLYNVLYITVLCCTLCHTPSRCIDPLIQHHHYTRQLCYYTGTNRY